ncbi:MAG TPA: DUF4838 domain-containing protein [Clostridiales bacterium]|nr:DUF4838 domain-containing protein [Clostridiales bacterium]HQK73844.1 DUF4838 domain-containing protein [Clostridiales bacterium]
MFQLPDFKLLKQLFAAVAALVMFLSGVIFPALPSFVPEPETPAVDTRVKMKLSESGASDYVIVRGAACSPSERLAAQTLHDHLLRIGGADIPVVTDTAPAQAREIIVGKTNREGALYTVDRAALGDEGLMIRAVGQKVVIAGGEKRGTLYGVYTFLEEVLGCHWYTADLIVIPAVEDIEVPVDLNIVQKPYFEYRETDWMSPRNITYSIANKQNGNIYRILSEEQGGNMGYAYGFAHTLTTLIMPPDKYFADHPEYYALGAETGVRSPNQLCLTNPDTLRIVIEEVREILRTHPDAQIVSLTQHDNGNYCVCDNCKAVDDYEGSHSGTMIRFVNAVADAIKDDYPNVAIDTFAYQYTRKPPKHVIPRDNVIVRLCSIECCFSHPLNDPACADNAAFCADLNGWKDICRRIYIWDYTTNYSHFLGPFPNFGVIQKNIRFFAENNVRGIYEEGNYMAASSNGEFAELRAYMLCKLLWDPYLDYDAVMNGFLKAYYGPGWQYVREYIDMTTSHTGTCGNHMGIGEKMTSKAVLKLKPNEIAYCDELWAKAAELADTPEYLKHVRMSELSWRYWKGCNRVREFSLLQPVEAWRGANEQLFNDYAAYGITRCSEGKLLATEPNLYAPPSAWR